MSTVAALVLAAGLSSRMPGNKLLAHLRGKPVVRHVVETVLASRASPVLVIVGNSASAVTAALFGLPVQFVENPDFATGLSSSLKCGVRNVPADCKGALVLLGDMPFVTPSLLDRIVGAFDPKAGRQVIVPVRGGRRGNPVLWGRSLFPELLGLEGDSGAKRLLAQHEDVLCEIEADDDGALIDIDTPEDLKSHE